MGALTTFFFIFKGAILSDPSAIVFGTLVMPPVEAPLWSPSCKIETNVHPCLDFTLLVYIKGSSTLGKLYGIKPRCYWEQIWECIWEHFKNQEKKQKVPVSTPNPPPLPQKKKSWIFHECMMSPLAAWNFSFQNCLSSFFN